MKIFGREQVAWLALVAAAFGVLTALGFHFDDHVQGAVAAIVVFVFGVVNAIRMGDGIVALATGVATAAFSLFAAFGLEWPADKQSYYIGVITIIVGFFTRNHVDNPVPATVSPPNKLVDRVG